MTLDSQGNLYLTPAGENLVTVYYTAGELLDSIVVPEAPSNVCFGSPNRDELFITARTSIYKVRLNAKGIN